jgi:hypothetical protein
VITKEQLSNAMTRECDICLHLYSKLSPDAYGYRPSPAQRTTLELLQYLAACGIGGIRAMASTNWKLFSEELARTKEMPAEEFPAAMTRQKAEIEAFFASTSEKALETQTATMPGGGTLPLGAAILNGPLKWLAAYKLQLFLYAKATGAHEIGTANAWAGIDWKR